LILLNGIKLSDPQTGHHLLNIPVNIDNIEQIEVLKGPAARIFGQNAFSGAINIITKVPDQRKVTLDAYGGSFGTYGLTGAVALPTKGFKQYLSYSYDASDGYMENTDFKINNLFYQSDLDVGAGTIKVFGGFIDKKFGANSFYTTSFPGQYEETTALLISAGYQYNNHNLVIKPRIYWRRHDDEFLLVRENPDFYRNLHTTNVIGSEVNGSYRSSLGLTGIGLEYRRELIKSNNLRRPDQPSEGFSLNDRDNVGIFLEHQFEILQHLDITPGVYFNYFSDYGWNYFPGIDAGYQLTSSLRAFGNIGKSFRIPTYTDLYYVGPDNVGNPDLSPEEATSFEFGLRHMKNGVRLSAVYFNRDATNLIDYVREIRLDEVSGQPLPDSLQGPFQPKNFANVNTQGLELSAELDFRQMIAKNAWIKNIFLSYNYLNSDLQDQVDFQSRYFIDNLRHQFVASIRHSIFKNIEHNLRMRYNERVGMEDYYVMDSRISWNHKDLKLYGEVTNLTNQDYRETITQMPGRWFRFGVQYQINY